MRVWDIHPGYLSRGNLLGQHAEIHALLSVICGGKKGYASHPETLRWKSHPDKLKLKHDLTVKEMELRDYQHASPCHVEGDDGKSSPAEQMYVDHPADQFEILRDKYREKPDPGRIPIPVRASSFWAHHKYSVMSRGYQYYKEVQGLLKSKDNLPVGQERGLVERVLDILEKPVAPEPLLNVVQHLWGYFKKEASGEEKESYLHWPDEQIPQLLKYLYRLAQKYERKYLLQSTVFADFTDYP